MGRERKKETSKGQVFGQGTPLDCDVCATSESGGAVFRHLYLGQAEIGLLTRVGAGKAGNGKGNRKKQATSLLAVHNVPVLSHLLVTLSVTPSWTRTIGERRILELVLPASAPQSVLLVRRPVRRLLGCGREKRSERRNAW